MEMPDMAAVKANASSAMSSAKALGQSATAKANSGVSILSTSVKDGIQAVDGFGKKVSDVLTETKSTLSAKIAEAKSWLTETSIGDLGSLKDMLAKAAELKKDAQALQNQITTAITDGIGTVRGLTDSVLGPAEDALWKLQQIPFDKITDGKYWLNLAVGSSVSDVNSLGNLTKRLLGDVDGVIDGYKDKYAELSLAIGITDHAVTLGDSSVVGAVIDKYGSEAALRESIINRFPDAIMQGNTGMLKTIIEKFGPAYVLVKYPTAVQLILTGYRMPVGSTVNDFPVLGATLLEVLNMLDPQWAYLKTVPNANHNLKVFTNASVSAQRVLAGVSGLGYVLKIAANYPNSDVLSVARNHYPMAGFNS